MSDANVSGRIRRGQIDDPLTDVLRDGVAQLLAHAIEAEVATHCLPQVASIELCSKIGLA